MIEATRPADASDTDSDAEATPTPTPVASTDESAASSSGESPEDGGDSGGDTPPPPTPSAPAPPPKPRVVRSLVIGSIIAIGLAVFLFVGLGTNSGPGTVGPVVGIGSQAPGFTLPSLTGGTPVTLDALGKAEHRPVILNFFASWCIPCQKETPLLARTSAAEQARGGLIRFVGVDVADTPSQAVPFVQESGIAYPVGADSTLKVTSVLYGLNGEPNTFFIDSTGKVIGHKIGALSAAELRGWMYRLAGASG